MARIYLASSWRNEEQANAVEILRHYGHQVYDFKNPETAHGFSWDDVDLDAEQTDFVNYHNTITTSPRCAQGYMNDLRAMEWSDTGIMLLPCGNSAHIELGYMAGRGKRTIIVTGYEFKPDLMYLVADDIVRDITDAVACLSDG